MSKYPLNEIPEVQLALSHFGSDNYRPGFGKKYDDVYSLLITISEDMGMQHFILMGIDDTGRGVYPQKWISDKEECVQLAYMIGNRMRLQELKSDKIVPDVEGTVFDPKSDSRPPGLTE